MDRFLYLFGMLVFAVCFIGFIMSFVGNDGDMLLVGSVFGMLNASIAMGVAEILQRQNRKTTNS